MVTELPIVLSKETILQLKQVRLLQDDLKNELSHFEIEQISVELQAIRKEIVNSVLQSYVFAHHYQSTQKREQNRPGKFVVSR